MKRNAMFLIAIFSMFFLGGCAVADKAANAWLSRSGESQEMEPLNQESTKQVPMIRASKAKRYINRDMSKKSITPVDEEDVASHESESSTNKPSKRSGLIGWYMDAVDNSPLNPLNMKGSGGRLPEPVERAMEMQGMKRNRPNQEPDTPTKDTPKRSGLMGWYMDAVDNSPLNPLNMKGRRSE
ncbi:MAG: hypothetical protein ACWGHO_04250 [Candidatus Moraniibacteriota bacterium]